MRDFLRAIAHLAGEASCAESTNSKATVLIGRVSNGHRDGSDHDLMGYIVFTYTFHVWGAKRDVAPVATHGSGVK